MQWLALLCPSDELKCAGELERHEPALTLECLRGRSLCILFRISLLRDHLPDTREDAHRKTTAFEVRHGFVALDTTATAMACHQRLSSEAASGQQAQVHAYSKHHFQLHRHACFVSNLEKSKACIGASLDGAVHEPFGSEVAAACSGDAILTSGVRTVYHAVPVTVCLRKTHGDHLSRHAYNAHGRPWCDPQGSGRLLHRRVSTDSSRTHTTPLPRAHPQNPEGHKHAAGHRSPARTTRHAPRRASSTTESIERKECFCCTAQQHQQCCLQLREVIHAAIHAARSATKENWESTSSEKEQINAVVKAEMVQRCISSHFAF